MTTKVESLTPTQVSKERKISTKIFVISAILLVALASVFVFTQRSAVEETTSVSRALEADAARYNGLAASYAAQEKARQRILEIEAGRYNGLAARYVEN